MMFDTRNEFRFLLLKGIFLPRDKQIWLHFERKNECWFALVQCDLGCVHLLSALNNKNLNGDIARAQP